MYNLLNMMIISCPKSKTDLWHISNTVDMLSTTNIERTRTCARESKKYRHWNLCFQNNQVSINTVLVFFFFKNLSLFILVLVGHYASQSRVQVSTILWTKNIKKNLKKIYIFFLILYFFLIFSIFFLNNFFSKKKWFFF